jgi:cytochrome c oxidase assembly factor CtaG
MDNVQICDSYITIPQTYRSYFTVALAQLKYITMETCLANIPSYPSFWLMCLINIILLHSALFWGYVFPAYTDCVVEYLTVHALCNLLFNIIPLNVLCN